MAPPSPLSVLDLLPRSSGQDNTTAMRNTIDLASRAEQFGYARYWFAEHHTNPGVIGSSPAVEIALVAGATSTIRLGSAGVQFGHRTPLATVEVPGSPRPGNRTIHFSPGTGCDGGVGIGDRSRCKELLVGAGRSRPQ
jgi:hypothetical protein